MTRTLTVLQRRRRSSLGRDRSRLGITVALDHLGPAARDLRALLRRQAVLVGLVSLEGAQISFQARAILVESLEIEPPVELVHLADGIAHEVFVFQLVKALRRNQRPVALERLIQPQERVEYLFTDVEQVRPL